MPEGMMKTEEVRGQMRIDRRQISRYRKAGLFPFDPIAIRREGLGSKRVYPMEALTTLEVLEGLRKRGFTLGEMRILFCTGVIADVEKGVFSFDDKARVVIAPERIAEAGRIIEAVVESYYAGYKLPPGGRRPFGKG